MEGIYRRPSGVYVARLVVPARLRHILGRTEFVASTGVRDHALAKIVGAELLAAWRRALVEAAGEKHVDLLQVKAGSPLLSAAGGTVSLMEATTASGFTTQELLRFAGAGRLALYVSPGLCEGFIVAVDDLERDAETGGIDVPIPRQMPEGAIPTSDPGRIRIGRRDAALLQADLLAGAAVQLMLFELPGRSDARFAPSGGFRVDLNNLQISSTELDRIRSHVALKITEEQLDEARRQRSSREPSASTKRVGEAVALYMAERSAKCAPDQARRIRAACELFVELLGNPRLADVDRPLLRRYRDELLPRVPANENKIRLQHGTSTVTDSIAAVEGTSWPRISETERVKRMQWLCGLFEWLAVEKWIPDDPSVGLAAAVRPKVKKAKHTARDLFTREDLQQIFSAIWFRTGRGVVTKQGTYREFLPYYFWLPLIGVYTGARINEIAQLALSDIRHSANGVWYFDINEDDEESERKVKNAQSHREIPLHPHLLALGLIEWRQHLVDLGHKRLFPELLYDPVKGYSKAAVKWFSAYLKRFGWERDGKRVFHSFRHTLASECLNRLGLDEALTAQISGHQRSTSVLGSTYRKDLIPVDLVKAVARLDFGLSEIAKFDVDEGSRALSDALNRKRNKSDQQGK